MAVKKKLKREDYETYSDFKTRALTSVQKLLDELGEVQYLEEEGGEHTVAGPNEFYSWQIYTPSGHIRDISVDLYPKEAIVSISERRGPTDEEKEYFYELADMFEVLDEFKF